MSWEPKKTAVSALGLPRDVILGDVLVNFVGRGQVNVENYRSILIYTDTLVKLQAKNCKVLIHGNRLRIDYYTSEEMKMESYISFLVTVRWNSKHKWANARKRPMDRR